MRRLAYQITFFLSWTGVTAQIFRNKKKESDVLFGGVRQLVLSAAVVRLLDTRVGPQAFNSYDVGLIKAIDLLDVHFLHKHGVGLKTRRREGSEAGNVVRGGNGFTLMGSSITVEQMTPYILVSLNKQIIVDTSLC